MASDSQRSICKLCGEPMPQGEEVFFYHGYSGPCPKPPLPHQPDVRPLVAEAERFFDANNARGGYDKGEQRNGFARFAAAFYQHKAALRSQVPSSAPQFREHYKHDGIIHVESDGRSYVQCVCGEMCEMSKVTTTLVAALDAAWLKHIDSLASPAAPTTETVGEELRKAAEELCATIRCLVSVYENKAIATLLTKDSFKRLEATLSRSAVPVATHHLHHVACSALPTQPIGSGGCSCIVTHLAARPSSPVTAETVRREALEEAAKIADDYAAEEAKLVRDVTARLSDRSDALEREVAAATIADRVRSLQHSTAPEQGEGGRK